MASTIKVDTIENISGSGNVSLGSGHNLVVPGNITGQGDEFNYWNLHYLVTQQSVALLVLLD